MGFFSWRTQDTDRSIASIYSNRDTFKVYMVNPVTGDIYAEDNYEGYGVFGGKDFYELVAELNGGGDRNDGIDISMRDSYVSPLLLENYESWQEYKGQIPEVCIFQGYFYPSEADEVKERINACTKRINDLETYIHFQEKEIAQERNLMELIRENKSIPADEAECMCNTSLDSVVYLTNIVTEKRNQINKEKAIIKRLRNKWGVG